MKNEIIIFENQNVKLEVNMKDETVWLNKEQMSQLFAVDRTGISRHIKNIYNEKELEKQSTCAKFAHMGNDGNQNYETDYYNLDMIISVGYRVKSKNGIIFRQWANKILKEYLVKGYAIDERKVKYLENTVKLLEIANRGNNHLTGNEAKDILNVINEYSKALNLLDDYDHKKISKTKGCQDKIIITYEECLSIINKLKFNNYSKLFALERDNNFKSIIKDIYVTYDGHDLYSTNEEKCANLLYLTVKNHAFIDGNKRIAATIFIYFLQKYNLLYKNNKQVIDNNTLASITLLIAESNPKEKELLINLILNFLND